MQCPRCGAEVANAKFCGSCGTPVQAPAAAYQQPYPAPMPMPPRRKSLTWLWVTLGVLGFVAVAVIGVLVALGEDDPVVPPVAEQKQSGPGTSVAATGADAAVKSYLEARKAGNLAAAYGMLSSAARSAYTQDEFAAFYGASALTAFGKIEVVKAQDPFYQVMVRDLKSGDTTFAGAPYTVVKEEGKFLVALENPMLDPLDAAFADELYEDAYQLTEQMLEINPFSYFAYYNGGWAEVELGRHQQGLAEFAEAGKYVIAEDKPELVRSVGIVYLRMQQWDQAVASLEEAITLGQAQNAHYRPDWFRQLAADLAVGYEQAGKTGRAIDLLETLYQSDPKGNWARNAAVRLERKPYKTENGMTTYKIMMQGVSFALPQDWVVSNETTGGDWWYARLASSPATRSDIGVYFHGDYLGKTLDEAVAGLLKRYQEPVGAPKRNVSIRTNQAVTLGGKPAVRLDFSDGTVSFLVKAGEQWVDFHWFNSPEGQMAIPKWLPTVQIKF